MTQTLTGAITAIAAVVAGVNGVKSAPAMPTEQMSDYPFAMTYLTGGNIEVSPIGTRRSLISVAIDLLTPRRDLALDMAILLPFVDSIPAALLAEVSDGGDIFSGNIETFGSIAITFLPGVDFGGVPMIGYRFSMENVKLQVNL